MPLLSYNDNLINSLNMSMFVTPTSIICNEDGPCLFCKFAN